MVHLSNQYFIKNNRFETTNQINKIIVNSAAENSKKEKHSSQ